MSDLDNLYPITDRLRCSYNGRYFGGKMEVELPTAIMKEAADFIEMQWAKIHCLAERIAELEAQQNYWSRQWKPLRDRVADLETEVAELRNQILDTGPMLPKKGMTIRYMED